jgi:hypothetical protein
MKLNAKVAELVFINAHRMLSSLKKQNLVSGLNQTPDLENLFTQDRCCRRKFRQASF